MACLTPQLLRLAKLDVVALVPSARKMAPPRPVCCKQKNRYALRLCIMVMYYGYAKTTVLVILGLSGYGSHCWPSICCTPLFRPWSELMGVCDLIALPRPGCCAKTHICLDFQAYGFGISLVSQKVPKRNSRKGKAAARRLPRLTAMQSWRLTFNRVSWPALCSMQAPSPELLCKEQTTSGFKTDSPRGYAAKMSP
jgi:hypothetical protein